MSNANETRMDVYLVLATLAEGNGIMGQGFYPASHVYLALGSDLARYHRVAGILTAAGFAETTPDTIRLTPKGREAGLKVAKVLAEAEAEGA